MDGLPLDLCMRIFSFLDHSSLAASLQVCRKWREVCSGDDLWMRLFRARWGGDADASPSSTSRSWKDVYEEQDRCDRIGLGLKIIREGSNYYVVYQGKIQRFLGSCASKRARDEVRQSQEEEQQPPEEDTRISERILFFIGDLETSCAEAKRLRR